MVAPLAAYVPAVQTGNLVYTSGQLPITDGQLLSSGKVGADVTAEDAKQLARVCALNALAAVHALVGIDAVVKVVRSSASWRRPRLRRPARCHQRRLGTLR
ncbi:hypothetical protein MMUR_65870 [Mycolicibacterium murale]|uniref:Uncharacterized protein n=1 Tax=Mycolicibacterium murale TaxID=182220 RepID=A0A7I9WXS6_9MYCO|nr:hypothetical protein MMUR_65870 [Mycolicibacterium murale]